MTAATIVSAVEQVRREVADRQVEPAESAISAVSRRSPALITNPTSPSGHELIGSARVLTIGPMSPFTTPKMIARTTRPMSSPS